MFILTAAVELLKLINKIYVKKEKLLAKHVDKN